MPRIFSSFRTKVTLALVLSMFFVIALSNFLVYRFTLNSQFNQLRDKLMVIAQTASLMVDAELLMQVPLSREGINAPQYKIIAEKLKKIKEINPLLKYIYTMTKTGKEGVWQFVVDPEPVVKTGAKKIVTSYPGDKYNVSGFLEMQRAFNGPQADKQLTVDEWGTVLSGYAPIRDKNNKAVAVLGVDISAEDVYHLQKEINLLMVVLLAIGIFLSLSLGLFISQRISNPIKQLVEGTRRIAADDLDYKVEIKGDNEISELASSFNRMAGSLLESRKKLHEYFSRVLQSFIRIIEAKDPYTRGHSDRVAEYTEKIAQAMGFPADKVELARTAAELHDIGKLGIREDVLNKDTKLTFGEWQSIQSHPRTGEEILKPLAVDEDILAGVKHHHEHYDGSGYPDGLTGDKTSIFAQIIAVADTYDAMTSNRAYRAALKKEAAMLELKKNAGTQFNARVVEAFLEVLQGEPIQK